MSGYAGDASASAQQNAMDNIDNLIGYARAELYDGPSLTHCDDCGDSIPEARRLAIACSRCCSCQEMADRQPKSRIRLLAHIL